LSLYVYQAELMMGRIWVHFVSITWFHSLAKDIF